MPTFDVQAARKAGLSDEQIQRAAQLHGATLSEPLSSPQQGRQASFLERAALSFGDEQGRERFKQQRGITQVEQPGLERGDIADVAGGALPVIGGILGSIPGGTAGSIVPGGGTVVGAGLTGAAGGAAGEGIRQAIGRAIGVQDEGDVGKVGAEAALQGIAPGVGKITTEAAKRALGSTGRELLRKTLRPAVSTLDKYQKRGIDLLEEWVKLGVRGTREQMLKQAEQIGRRSKSAVDTLIGQSDATISLTKVQNAINNSIANAAKRARQTGNQAKADRIEEIGGVVFDNLRKQADKGGNIAIQVIQQMKQDVQGELGERFGGEAAVTRAQSLIQKGLKELIETDSGVPGIAQLNRTTQVSKELTNTLKKLDNRSARGFTDSISRAIGTALGTTAGAAVGSGVGFQAGGVPGAIAGAGVGATAGRVGTSAVANLLSSPFARTARIPAIQALQSTGITPQSVIGNLLLNRFRNEGR